MNCTLSDVDSESDDGEIRDNSKNLTPSLSLSSEGLTKKQKREVVISAGDKKEETLLITQKVDSKKKKTKNVMDSKLGEGLRKNKIEMGQEYCKKLEEVKIIVKKISERIVPNCFRYKCHIGNKKIRRNQQGIDRSCKRTSDSLPYSYKSKSKRKQPIKKRAQRRPKDKKEHTPSPFSLSSINSDTKKQCQITYEDVSSDSFTSRSDGELDTLIKRTKEREKHLTVSSNFPCHRSTTPQSVDLSSEDTMDSTGTSIHSQATFVLDRQVCDLTKSPVTNHSCKAGPLQQSKKGSDKNCHDMSPCKVKIFELISDSKTEISIDPDSHLTYYHYHNVTHNNNNVECYSKIENNNNIYTDQHTFNPKNNSNG